MIYHVLEENALNFMIRVVQFLRRREFFHELRLQNDGSTEKLGSTNYNKKLYN